MHDFEYKISKLFLGGDTPEPPLREGATPSRTHPPGRPTALRAFGRPATAARPTVGTLTPGHPLCKFLATPLVTNVGVAVAIGSQCHFVQ